MSWHAVSTFLLLGAVVATAQSQHQNHVPKSSEEYAKVLNDPERDAWQKPHEVVMALELRADENIADIGAGTGYFSRRFARHAGKVFAVDIDTKLLELAAKEAPANHQTVLAAVDDPKLDPDSVDTIFFCDVLHHIDGRAAYYAKLNRALRKGGRVVVVDFEKKPTPVGPPETMRLSKEEVEKELDAAGFKKSREWNMLPYQYFLEFARK